jgi:hypothetical protein
MQRDAELANQDFKAQAPDVYAEKLKDRDESAWMRDAISRYLTIYRASRQDDEQAG